MTPCVVCGAPADPVLFIGMTFIPICPGYCWVELDRLVGACIAMSRFMVWVCMEASAQGAVRLLGHAETDAEETRYWAFEGAIERGLLRLDWSRP